jgi:membrane protein DedA with SNARE-associated domain
MFGLSALQVGSPLSYLLAFRIPALDAVVPVLPSETVIVALGVATAGSADPRIALLAAVGACAGDNLGYFLGWRFSPWVSRHFFSGEKGARRWEWAQQTLDRRGALLIVACRFIPGGRTAVTLTCGVTHFPRRTFLLATAFAGAIWATYAFFVGRLGGKAFEHKPWLSLVVALAGVSVVSVIVEVGRRVVSWRKNRRRESDSETPPPG